MSALAWHLSLYRAWDVFDKVFTKLFFLLNTEPDAQFSTFFTAHNKYKWTWCHEAHSVDSLNKVWNRNENIFCEPHSVWSSACLPRGCQWANLREFMRKHKKVAGSQFIRLAEQTNRKRIAKRSYRAKQPENSLWGLCQWPGRVSAPSSQATGQVLTGHNVTSDDASPGVAL